MSAEYTGKMDRDPAGVSKTVPVLPRPLRSQAQRQRAENLTGDPSGLLPTDDGAHWQGLPYRQTERLLAEQQARAEQRRALEEAWY